jgi:hypothetical protein
VDVDREIDSVGVERRFDLIERNDPSALSMRCARRP